MFMNSETIPIIILPIGQGDTADTQWFEGYY